METLSCGCIVEHCSTDYNRAWFIPDEYYDRYEKRCEFHKAQDDKYEAQKQQYMPFCLG